MLDKYTCSVKARGAEILKKMLFILIYAPWDRKAYSVQSGGGVKYANSISTEE